MLRYLCFFFFMRRRPPRSTRTDTLFPYTTLFRSLMVLGIGRPKLPKALSYEESRELAHNGSDRARADLAVRIDLRPEVLYFLAEDPPTEVRRRIAAKAKRSEERRVGKERVITCRSGWSPSHSKKNYTRDISNQV